VIEAYLILANRIRGEMDDLENLIERARRAMDASGKKPQDKDFFIDSAALNLHDFYVGIERLFRLIASTVDGDVPAGDEWHRDLLRQMNIDLPELRPQVISKETMIALDEYLRFRHVVRNVYTFTLKLEPIKRLVNQSQTVFIQVRDELLIFADFLEQVGS